MFNSYPEEFKRNAVSVIKSGALSSYRFAKRFGIPVSSVRNWLGNRKYSLVQPAGAEILETLTPPVVEQEKETQTQRLLVPITKTANDEESTGEVKIRIGKIEIEVGKNCDKDVLSTIIRVLGEAGVL